MSDKNFYLLTESQTDSIIKYLTSHKLEIKNFDFPKAEKERLYDIIEKFQQFDPEGMANLEDIFALAKITGINGLKAEDMINKMKNAGQLFEPRNGRVKIIY